MNTWTYIVALCLFTVFPGVLFGVFWWYIIKRGWGSRWLLAISITVLLSLVFIVISFAAKEKSILFIGMGFSALGGIIFYIYLKFSPLSDALIGKSQNLQVDLKAMGKDERKQKESAKLAARDTLIIGFLQILPLIIGLAIIVLSNALTSLALFVIGFYGILKIILRPTHGPIESYRSKGKIISGILIAAFAWSLALYTLVK